MRLTCFNIDDEFRHNIVKVAVDPRGDSRDFFQYFDNVMMKFIANNRTDALKTDKFHSCSLTHRINYKSCFFKIANERARISVVIVKFFVDIIIAVFSFHL